MAMQEFTKILNPGRTPEGQVFVKAKWTGARLSIVGVVGPRKSSNCAGGCGQIADDLDYITVYARGWDRASVSTLKDIWNRWHLHDMQAGCEHQRGMDWNRDNISQPCPVCGYRYGTAWLSEAVPDAVLKTLQEFPDTQRTPAWV